MKKRIVKRISASERTLKLLEMVLAVIAASAVLSAIQYIKADPWQTAKLITVHSLIIENYIASLLIAFCGAALYEQAQKEYKKER